MAVWSNWVEGNWTSFRSLTWNPKGFVRSKTEVNNIKLMSFFVSCTPEEGEKADMLRDSFPRRGMEWQWQGHCCCPFSNTKAEAGTVTNTAGHLLYDQSSCIMKDSLCRPYRKGSPKAAAPELQHSSPVLQVDAWVAGTWRGVPKRGSAGEGPINACCPGPDLPS